MVDDPSFFVTFTLPFEQRSHSFSARKRYYEKEVETVTGSGVMKKDQELKRKGIRKLWGTGRLIHVSQVRREIAASVGWRG